VEADMKRVFGALALALLVAGTTRADIGPPKGMKRVTIDHKITTEKDFSDYDFYTSVGGDGKFGKFNGGGVTAVKFDAKTPIEIKGAGRNPGIGRQGSLYAVPKDAAKKYDSEKDFFAALRSGKVEGQIRAKHNFDSITTIKDTDPRTTVLMEWKVENLDAKDGFAMKYPKLDEVKPVPPKEGKDGLEDEEEDAAVAFAPKGGVWIAGLAATLGLVFAGLWLARRSR
jgi:hypothetical protein